VQSRARRWGDAHSSTSTLALLALLLLLQLLMLVLASQLLLLP
jgi:hypothetical protein